MAKLRFLEVVSVAVFTSFVLWQATSSISLGPSSSTVTEETVTTTKGSVICDGITCPPGQHCVLNTTENRPDCICSESCHEFYNPVCGSDGQTYIHVCDLGREVCKNKTDIRIQYLGKCYESSLDDCKGKSCPANEHCVMIQNATQYNPECRCKESCPFIYDPVCGSDGNTYVNECRLRVEACYIGTNTTIKQKGTCKDEPCDAITCPPGQRCILNTTENRPVCICKESCTEIYDPVCGSDGQTYSHVCDLGLLACKTNRNITVQYLGICAEKTPSDQSLTTATHETSTTGGCSGVECPFYGKCLPDANNRPTCVCALVCSFTYRPVCGSNNQTYDNDCELRVDACLTKINITIQRKGICNASPSECDDVSCPPDKYCVVNTTANRTDCICNEKCFEIDDPVCGSDGRSYANDCVLGVKACKTKTNITVEHEGLCNGKTPSNTGTRGSPCDGVTCHTGEICQLNSEGQPQCTCPRICPLNEDPVCGSDGKTYGNECMLRVEACWSNTNITIKHKEICNDSCSGFECPFYGQCVLDAYNRTTCVCVLACPFIDRPVCGSDNKTYVNDCALRTESCRTNTSITFLYPGRCEGGSGCDGIVCPPLNVCKLSSDGKPKCVCNETCSSEDAPVCASNGKTYGNRCLFNFAACWYDNDITVAYVGKCKPES